MSMDKKDIQGKVKDYLTMEEFKQSIGEGLIMTHSIEKTSDFFRRWASHRFKVFMDKETNVIFLEKKDKNDGGDDSVFIKFMNNYGWFLSAYLKDGVLVKPTEGITGYEGMRFEPKFDMEATLEQRYLYHVTEKSKVPKILKIGLTPKTNSKVTYHPDRIYLATSDDSANDIMEMFLEGNHLKEPVKLRIDRNGMYNKFLIDSQFLGGVYTLHNIPPTNIEIVQ